jgi:hypothetical protein
MPDIMVLGKLQRGVESWNAWRESIPYVPEGYPPPPVYDLSRANLEYEKLPGANLAGVNLFRAKLSFAELSRSDLRGSDLRGANLRHTHLREANMGQVNLARANLSFADLTGADMRGVNLAKANLTCANLREADLTYANLWGANLSSTHLEGANLTDTHVRERDLRKAFVSRDMEAGARAPRQQQGRETATAEVVVSCRGCGRAYRLGVDAAVITDEGVASRFAVVSIVGGSLKGGTEGSPDLVDAYPLGERPTSRILTEVARVRAARAAAAPRWWRCRPCGMTNPYPWTETNGGPPSEPDHEQGPPRTPQSRGIATIAGVCSRNDLLDDALLERGIRQLQGEKAGGARALAGLMRELSSCRSPGILDALRAAMELEAVPELISVARDLLTAPPTVPMPPKLRFTPQIAGGGRVGWDDGCAADIRERAREALRGWGVEAQDGAGD